VRRDFLLLRFRASRKEKLWHCEYDAATEPIEARRAEDAAEAEEAKEAEASNGSKDWPPCKEAYVTLFLPPVWLLLSRQAGLPGTEN
jgi:hypothetical protein